jgi:hypothetical protein
MSPPIAETDLAHHAHDIKYDVNTKNKLATGLQAPLRYSGTLDQYKSLDVTPVIGREFPTAQLSEILSDDEKVRDLAITGQPLFPVQHMNYTDRRKFLNAVLFSSETKTLILSNKRFLAKNSENLRASPRAPRYESGMAHLFHPMLKGNSKAPSSCTQ